MPARYHHLHLPLLPLLQGSVKLKTLQTRAGSQSVHEPGTAGGLLTGGHTRGGKPLTHTRNPALGKAKVHSPATALLVGGLENFPDGLRPSISNKKACSHV